MVNYPKHSQKQPLPHHLDPQPKTSHGTEKNPIPLPHPTHTPQEERKMGTFTFMSPNIRKVTNLFKQAGVKIAFRGKNTLACKSKQQTQQEPHLTTNPVFTN